MAAIAKVEPLTTARALRGPFDYRIPREMAEIGIGSMLVVPFGRRRLLGVVVDVASESDVPPDRLVEPISALESGVPAELVKLGLWVAESYCSTAARGLALVLPPGTGTARSARPAARAQEVVVAALTDAGRAALEDDEVIPLGERQRGALASLVSGPLPSPEIRARAGASAATLRRLEERGLVSLARERRLRSPTSIALGGSEKRSAAPTLTSAQRGALEPLLAAIESGTNRRLLLHGVTGSGKTEVYLRAAAAALERGRSAIVLVPEIALTPQTARRFRDRFGDTVAILHSQLGLGERYDEWQRLRSGEARLCVGPRSAIFAPVARLGLVVVDEEHDSAYKQESDPRYDARRVAERRAEATGAVLVSGSATPSPESWSRMERIELPDRVDGRRLPPVELVDMREARHPLHRVTREALDEVRRRRSKAIVLVSRRGWAPFVVCRSCGSARMCPHCDVTLTLHREGGDQELLCHHCGHRERSLATCPTCGSTALARHGAGTQRLEAELATALDPLPVFRLDGDAGRRRDGVAGVLSRFEAAPAGVLVGTQMVAQGHDFPEVELAVVQDADATLRFPDFRAEERTFSLVAQLAGRSGRGPGGGRVLVQTLWPEAPCLQQAARHDARAFLDAEVERRRVLGYPPFAALVRIVTSAPEAAASESAAADVASALTGAPLTVLGPAPLFRVKGRFRHNLLVKSADRAAAVRAVGEAVARVSPGARRRGVAFSVDADPQ